MCIVRLFTTHQTRNRGILEPGECRGVLGSAHDEQGGFWSPTIVTSCFKKKPTGVGGKAC